MGRADLIESPSDAADSFISAVKRPEVQNKFERKVKNTDYWKDHARKALDTFNNAMRTVIQDNLYKKGIDAVSNSKWQDALVDYGISNWANVIAGKKDEYRSGIEPVISKIKDIVSKPEFEGSPESIDDACERVDTFLRGMHELAS